MCGGCDQRRPAGIIPTRRRGGRRMSSRNTNALVCELFLVSVLSGRLVSGGVLGRHAIGLAVGRVTATIHLRDLWRDALFEFANLELPRSGRLLRIHDDLLPSIGGRVRTRDMFPLLY